MLPGLTVVKPVHTGMHQDETVVEPGTRPGLHRDHVTPFDRKGSPVYHSIPACLHRGEPV